MEKGKIMGINVSRWTCYLLNKQDIASPVTAIGSELPSGYSPSE